MVFSLLALSCVESGRHVTAAGAAAVAARCYPHQNLGKLLAEGGDDEVEEDDLAQHLPRPVQQRAEHGIGVGYGRVPAKVLQKDSGGRT